MGAQSSLGPIDPQFKGLPAHGIIEEFGRAYQESKQDQQKIPMWQPIIAKYHPTMIGECQKVIAWSEQMVRQWLKEGMLKGDRDAEQKIDSIIKGLGDHALTLSHARHLSMAKCEEMGLVIEHLEENPKLQDAVLSLHHACIHTLSATPATKIIENHRGKAYIQQVQQVQIRQQQ